MFLKRSILLFFVLSSAAVAMGYYFFSFSVLYPKFQQAVFPKGSTYNKEWEKVDSLTTKGLTQSALKVVEGIYSKAKTDKNSAQIVKAIIHRIKLESYMEEYSLQKSIDKLNDELQVSKYPLKPVLHSVLAELYWSYYETNRWKFQERSQIAGSDKAGFKMDDIHTWDLKTIVDHTVKNYQFSLKNIDSLKRTSLNIYDDILINDKPAEDKKSITARKLRPTLYDFLAHRAVDFYMNEEPDVIRPASRFELNSENYFGNPNEFIKLSLTSGNDSLNLKFYALKLLQDLTAFHSASPSPGEETALIDVDLKRLKFVHNKSIVEGKDSLYLQALTNLEKKFLKNSASTEISYEIAHLYNENASEYKPLVSEENKWDKKTALAICEDAIKRFPDSFGANNCRHLISLIKTRSLIFKMEEANLPDQPFRARIEYMNLNKIYIRIIKTDINKFNKQTEDNYGEKLINRFLQEKSIKEWTVELPDDGDYQSHSVEIKIPDGPAETSAQAGLPLGHYVVLMSSDKNFSYQNNAVVYENCNVTAMTYIQKKSEDGGYDFVVMHRETGQPLKGVNAQLWYHKYDDITRLYEYIKGDSYITDENGSFHASPSSEEYRNFYVEFTNGNDKMYSDNAFYISRNNKQEKIKFKKTFLFTDRTIYRPGQTIYFKGIILETDGETNQIKPKEKVTVTLKDVNYQSVASLDLVSNDYGSYNGTFTLPQSLLNGQMNISDGSGSVNFSVEEYKRPRFEVTFNPIKGAYKLGENVIVAGKAQSYAGSTISNAEVKYRVVRNASFPYYWCWRGIPPYSSEMEITNGIIATNDTGGFVISFNAIADLSIKKSSSPIYNYTIYADVTDITGEMHSNQNSVSVGYQAMKLEVSIGEQVNRDSVQKVKITAANLNGETEHANVKIEIWKQKEPDRLFRKRLWEQPDKQVMTKDKFYASFPNDVYADEDNRMSWEKTTKVFSEEFDTQKAKEFLLASISKWEKGAYVVEAIAKDKFGEEVKDIKYFTLYSSNEKTVPENVVDWFVFLKNKGEPGEKASFLIGSKEKDVKILYELEHKNQIIKKEWLTLSNEQKRIEVPIEEKYRGNFGYHFVFIKNGRAYQHDGTVLVPYTNKDLTIEFETFRSKLIPGQKEEWKLKIKNSPLLKTGAADKISAELLASMYDASLDAFGPHNWYFSFYNSYYASMSWEIYSVAKSNTSAIFSKEWNVYPSFADKYYDKLNWFGYYTGTRYYYRGNHTDKSEDGGITMMVPSATPHLMEGNAVSQEVSQEASAGDAVKSGNASTKDKPVAKPDKPLSQIQSRSNLNETAFFFPSLETDAEGSVIIKFTIPESLTRWKMMGLAHTKDLKYGQIAKELVTQKELMVTPHAPRFFREGDSIVYTAKVSNLSSADMDGTAQLFLYDAVTMKDITTLLAPSGGKSFTVKKSQNAPLEWSLIIPEGISAVTCKVVAKAGDFSDGEESTIPVLTNKMLVTESFPLAIRSKQTKSFKFEKFISQNNGSPTLRNHKVTLEFCANPAWYAVQSLPYIMESPYDCSEQIFSRYYANSIASHLANSSPKIKAVFDSWKSGSKESFLSNLQKNQELKSVLLEETPWVLEAKDESERKKRIGLLFDFNKMSNDLESALNKLQKMQVSNGGWPWFEGMPDDRYITQHIVTGMGHLDHLGVKNIRQDPKTWNMISNAVRYLDNRIREDYEWLLKHDKKNIDKDHLSYEQIQYLYARSYFLGGTSGKEIGIENKNQKAFDYYKTQAQKYWLGKGRYMNGMIALGLFRYGDKKTSADIMKSLKENALVSEEMGMYWKENYEGFYWHEAPIESQALLIEAFDEVANDKKAVDDLRVWLLKSKQTQNWRSTKATTEAVYALLLRGTDWLDTESNVEISLGDTKIDPTQIPDVKAEAGTGYFKTSWSGNNIKPQMGNVTITKKDEGVSWGALYWQYFEQLDKITSHKTPLQLVKKLFIEKNTAAGPVIELVAENTKLKPGDKLKVRIELRVDRNMEYVHMKDMRASGFEPVNVFSSYKYQDGLFYYESTRDAATNFFFAHLAKGTYVFEYPLLVSHAGNFSNGITTIQCMYAPEFTSNSEGIRVKVGK